jgi:2-polyprenyl-3-methyl-5-hydroxy-6-metoxy-1,4-benzoquinol methylase
VRIDADTLREMAAQLSADDRDEMAIPSFLHKNPALRWMAWRRIEVVARLIEADCPRGGTVLDFGCGTGVLFEASATRADRIYGVDLVLDAARLWVLKRGLHQVTLVPAADVGTIPDASVDLIVAAEVLEHIDDPTETLAFFRRVLKPGGALLVSLPTENRAYRLGRRLAGFSGHYHDHDAWHIDANIQRSGFARRLAKTIPGPGPLAIYLVARYERAP